MLIKANIAIEEKSYKKNTIRTFSFCNIKLIFILLIKLIAIDVKLFIIYI